MNDVWRLNRQVTLNFGVRWEPNLAPKDRNGFVVGCSRENFDKGIRSTVYPNAPIGLMFKGDPGFPDQQLQLLQQLQCSVAAVWSRVGPERRRSADHPDRLRHLQRYGDSVEDGASPAELAVREQLQCDRAERMPWQAKQERLSD